MGMLDEALRATVSTVVGLFTDDLNRIRRTTRAAYSLTAGTETREFSRDHKVKTTPPENYSLREINGASIQAGDFKVTAAAQDLTVEPTPETDTLVRPDGTTFRIITVEKVMSGDEVCAYVLQCRK